MSDKARDGKITIIGMGPGSSDYLLPVSKEKISKADVLIGGKRHLKQFSDLKTTKKEITRELQEVREYITANYKDKKIVILVSGDPGFHSILTYLLKYFDRNEFEIIPGISSIQLAFSKLVLPWQDAQLISLHGKDLTILNNFLKEEKLGLLTDNINTPQAIAKVYRDAGITDKIIYTCENLSYSNEVIHKYEVNLLCQEPRKINNCVVVVCDAER